MISQKTVIAFLMVSAAILGCLLIFQPTIQSARASDTSRAGFFAVATATYDTTADLLWIVNVNQQQLLVYGADSQAGTVFKAGANLANVFGGRNVNTMPYPRTAPGGGGIAPAPSPAPQNPTGNP
jgi:hypothetical protein